MILIDLFENEVSKETLKEFIKLNGNFSITTEDDILDVHFLHNKFFIVKNSKCIKSVKRFDTVWNWIDNTDCQWKLQDELI